MLINTLCRSDRGRQILYNFTYTVNLLHTNLQVANFQRCECAQTKDEERQEKEVTEEPKRFMTQEMSRRFSLFEEALFVLRHRTQTEQYTTVTAVVQNVIQCYHVIYDEKKRTTTQASLESFFRRIGRIESNKEPEPVPLLLSMCEIAACPPSPFADSRSAARLPPLLPTTVSNSSCRCPQCQPLYVSCLYSAMYLSRCYIIRFQKKCFLYFVCLFVCLCIV